MTNFSNTNYEYLTENERQILKKCPYRLTLSIDELTKSAVKKHHDFDKPPRPQNSWIIFRRDYAAYLRLWDRHSKSKIAETAKECSLKWQKLSSEVKNFFKVLEKIACENHKLVYPNYKYKPKSARNSSGKKFIFQEQQKYPTSPANSNPTITSNSPQKQIDGSRSSTSAISTAPDNNQGHTNNFTTVIYNHRDYNNGLATIHQDYTDANDLAQNLTNNSSNELDNQPPILFDFFFGDNINKNTDDESYIINNDNNGLINNSSTPPNPSSLIFPMIPLISSPLSQSQSRSQLFITNYDLSNVIFDNFLHANFS